MKIYLLKQNIILRILFIFLLIGCSSSENNDDNGLQEESCTEPNGLHIPVISNTSATLAWGDTNNSRLFNVEYGLRGFVVGNGTRTSVNTISLEITNLTSKTEYDFYVRTNCGGNVFSNWSGPQSFVTD
ncbi:fibronectin type III domain-containing protein [Polaribacter porphyrae]|uniref:Fibronectin type-III domain-containing protein n=1 Tax=Polaribacter porphyrae TaxID=1137780 RepID=A0A2S7WMT0_9FLAO|nr:fibronectin type III domain-containing protein [Polaribacter porphyrae]PQJ78927.1 hypothetical protein BTO18_06925 [Polaribacter porphyrae]